MRSTIRCAVCSSCLTLLASLGSAGGGLGHARVVSRQGLLLAFFLQNSCSDFKRLFVRVGTYQYDSTCTKKINWVGQQVGVLSLCEFRSMFQILDSAFFWCAIFHFFCRRHVFITRVYKKTAPGMMQRSKIRLRKRTERWKSCTPQYIYRKNRGSSITGLARS